MKAGRYLLVILAIVFGVCLIAVAVGLNSGFQTWAARRVLAGHPEYHATLGRLAVGLQHAEVRDVRAEDAGAVVVLPALDIDMPLVSAAMKRQANIVRISAKGWTIDLQASPAAPMASTTSANPSANSPTSNPSPTPTPDKADQDSLLKNFQGVFSRLKLPVDFSLAEFDLEGEVILPAAAGTPSPPHIKIALHGGGLAVGHDGNFAFDVSGAGLTGNAPVGEVALRGTFTAGMDTPRTFNRLVIKADASATGPQVSGPVRLQLNGSALRSSTGEAYILSVADGKPLLDVRADFPGRGSKLTGTWNIDLHNTDLVPFAMGMRLPTFATTGSGNFETDSAAGETHVAGKLNIDASHLEQFNPQLSAVGATHLGANFDFSNRGSALRVQQLDIELAGARPVLSVHALQAFEFDPTTGALNVADASHDLLALAVQGLPLAWAAPFLPGLSVTGDDIRGDFVAKASNGGVAFRSRTPLVLANVAVTRGSSPLIRALDASTTFSADYTPQGWQAEFAPLTLKSGTASLLSVNFKLGQLVGKNQPVKATGHVDADLAALLAQPVLAGQSALRRGTATLDFVGAASTDKQEMQAKLVAQNLAADSKNSNVILPTISGNVNVSRSSTGQLNFQAPLVFDSAGHRSDLQLAGVLTPQPNGAQFDARVTSTLLQVDELATLQELLPAPVAAEKPGVAGASEKAASASGATPSPAHAPDAAPPWAGLTGQVVLDLKQVLYTSNMKLTSVGGTLKIRANQVVLENVHSGLGDGSDVKASGTVSFTPKVAEPYALSADLALNNFDTGPAFRALNPGKPPTVEGRFTVTGQASGSAPTLGDFADRVHGKMQLSSHGGIFRALSADVTEKVQRAQGAISAIGGLFGSKVADYANRTTIVSDIAVALKEIHYDQLSVAATRDESLNINVDELNLISPEIRLGGTGRVSYKAGTPLVAQPLELTLQLGARGKTADLMKRSGLLATTQDSLGYAASSFPIHIAGTLESPDTSDLRNSLLKAAGGSLLESLMGR